MFIAVLKRIAAFAAGLFFVFGAAELALRFSFLGWAQELTGAGNPPMVLGMVPPGPRRENALRILCAGNSHTQGAAESLSGAFPAQLEELLSEKFPGRQFQVINTGLGNWNSSEVLENLPGYLVKYRPQIVFTMIGEPNYWNYRLLPHHPHGWLADNLRRLKIVRLADLLLRFDPKGQDATMPSAEDSIPETPWIENPMLAQEWVAYFSEHPSFAAVRAADREVARSALVRWTSHPLAARRRRPFSTLLALDLFFFRYEDALAVSSKLLAMDSRQFDYFHWKALSTGKAGWAKSVAAKGLDENLALLEKRISRPDWLARIDSGAPAVTDEHFLLYAIAAAPGDFRFVDALAALYKSQGHEERNLQLYRDAVFENAGALKFHDQYKTLLPVKDVSRVAVISVMPPMIRFVTEPKTSFGEGPFEVKAGLLLEGEADSEMDRVRKWEAEDLSRIAQLVSDFGARLVLQTYPPYRHSLRERWPDPLIREAASSLGLPLSDTSRTLTGHFREHPSEEYYFKKNRSMQDDHLNTKGNRVVAELMLSKLEELGVLKP